MNNHHTKYCSIGLSFEQRAAVSSLLNVILSNEFVLYTKTLNYHWNIKGVHFGTLHELFKNQYEQLFTMIDAIAERIQALDHPAIGTLQQFLQFNQLTEQTGHLKEHDMILDLLQSHELVIRTLRIDLQKCDEFTDMGTNNFLTDIMEQHEKIAWILRSHLQT